MIYVLCGLVGGFIGGFVSSYIRSRRSRKPRRQVTETGSGLLVMPEVDVPASAVDIGNMPPAYAELRDDEIDTLMRAQCDPGSFVKRGDDYTESIWSWQRRAMKEACRTIWSGRGLRDPRDPGQEERRG